MIKMSSGHYFNALKINEQKTQHTFYNILQKFLNLSTKKELLVEVFFLFLTFHFNDTKMCKNRSGKNTHIF